MKTGTEPLGRAQQAAERLIRSFEPTAWSFAVAYAAVAVLLLAIAMRSPLSPWWVVGWLILVPCAAEIALRLFLRRVYGPHYRYAFLNYLLVDDPRYGYSLRAGFDSQTVPFPIFDRSVFQPGTARILEPKANLAARVRMRFDSHGFRGGGGEREPRPGRRIRIVCTGGSTTFCPSCDDAETWPSRLEVELQRRGIDAEVINAGVLGWYSYQERLRFERDILTLSPDVVIAHQGWNEEFLFSSLSLGRRWKPGLIRNAREAYNLYCAPNRFLSSTFSVGFHLTVRSLLKRLVFAKNMDFRNPARWEGLLRPEYMSAWADNLLAMADASKAKGILFYTLDYPSLVAFDDRPADRAVYITKTRLTALYADYQAASKLRISRLLRALSRRIPCLDLQQDFRHATGEDRLSLFHDEIHMRPAGNALFSKALAARLTEDPCFVARLSGAGPATNVQDLPERAGDVRAEAASVPPFLERFVLERIEQTRQAIDRSVRELPTERYTTW
jgi:lysophospholipase L1-like esterase